MYWISQCYFSLSIFAHFHCHRLFLFFCHSLHPFLWVSSGELLRYFCGKIHLIFRKWSCNVSIKSIFTDGYSEQDNSQQQKQKKSRPKNEQRRQQQQPDNVTMHFDAIYTHIDQPQEVAYRSIVNNIRRRIALALQIYVYSQQQEFFQWRSILLIKEWGF